MYRNRKFKAFNEGGQLKNYLDQKRRDIAAKINAEEEGYILNVDENEYEEHLVEKFTINPPDVDFGSPPSITDHDTQVPAERFPFGFFTEPGGSHPVLTIVCHFPYNSGDIDLLQYKPSVSHGGQEVFFKEEYVCVEILCFEKNEQKTKQEVEETARRLKLNLESLRKDIGDYNSQLPSLIRQTFKEHREKIANKHKFLESLDLPIKKRGDIPETYRVSVQMSKKNISLKPRVENRTLEPDPTLSLSIYNDILQRIHDLGKVFERYPSTYGDKDEETLRDHFLLHLQPLYAYEGSATGETFNKKGKTDILISYRNSHVFVAECKFWRGEKHYLGQLTQLMNYLTWRDSKAAAIVFVKNKDFSSVLETTKNATPKHPHFLDFVSEKDETWFNYSFHTNGDANRKMWLAVLLFHFPPVDS